jgi:large subunit ribosomal protein L14e
VFDVDVGRVCVKIAGREAGRKCVVVSTIDENFVLVDSPLVRRRRCNVRHLKPTEAKISLTEGAATGAVEKALKKAGVKLGE